MAAAEEDWHFDGPFKQMTFASRNQHRIYWGPLKRPLEWSLKTWLAPWSYVASVGYHDAFWYPRKARKQMAEAMDSDWGRLFFDWERSRVAADGRGYEIGIDSGAEPVVCVRSDTDHGRAATVLPQPDRLGAAATQVRIPSLRERLGLIAMAIRESPEVKRRGR